MKAKITTQLLAALSPSTTTYEVNDTELRGFQLRVQPTGTKTFLVAYRLRDGRKNRYVIGRTPQLTPAQARDEAKKVLGDVARGIDPNDDKRQQRREERKPTLEVFIDEHYAPWARAHLGTADKTLARMRVAFKEHFDKRLDSLTAWQFDKWKSERLKSGLKPTSVNRELASLRSALTKAVEWELIPEHPLRKVKQAKVDEDHRVRFLSDAEETRLREVLDERDGNARAARVRHNEWRRQRGHEALPLIAEGTFIDHIRPMILVTINTGLRRGELFKLKRSDIDMESLACSGLEHRHRCLVGMKHWMGQHLGAQCIYDRLQLNSAGADPLRERGARHRIACTAEDRFLAVQGQVVGELGHQDMRQQAGGWNAFVDDMRGDWRLHQPLALPACPLAADVALHCEHAWGVVQLLCDVFANALHLTTALAHGRFGLV